VDGAMIKPMIEAASRVTGVPVHENLTAGMESNGNGPPFAAPATPLKAKLVAEKDSAFDGLLSVSV